MIYGRYFGLSRAEAARRGDELLEFAQLTERAQRQGRAAVGRHEAPADDRPLADQRALDPAPRRAHDRPRPAGPPPALGAAVPAQAARRDARPDDALHGRGRAAVRPARRHGQGADRRRGLAAPAHRASTRPARSPSSGSRSASRRRSTASSTAWASASSACPTASSSTPTTARPRRPRPTSAGWSPRPCSSADRRSRTCSSASPAGASSTDGRAARGPARAASAIPRQGALAGRARRVRAHVAALPADLARVDLRHLRPAGPVPRRDGDRPGRRSWTRPAAAPWRRARTSQFLAPALLVSTVMQGSRVRGARSRSSAASAGTAATTRCTRRRCTPYAIAFGQIAWIATRATIVGDDLLRRDHRCSGRAGSPRDPAGRSRSGR